MNKKNITVLVITLMVIMSIGGTVRAEETEEIDIFNTLNELIDQGKIENNGYIDAFAYNEGDTPSKKVLIYPKKQKWNVVFFDNPEMELFLGGNTLNTAYSTNDYSSIDFKIFVAQLLPGYKVESTVDAFAPQSNSNTKF